MFQDVKFMVRLAVSTLRHWRRICFTASKATSQNRSKRVICEIMEPLGLLVMYAIVGKSIKGIFLVREKVLAGPDPFDEFGYLRGRTTEPDRACFESFINCRDGKGIGCDVVVHFFVFQKFV